MFSGGKKIPCCGLSLGVERIFSILVRKTQMDKLKANELQVHVIGVGDGVLEERMKICKELWDAGINVGFLSVQASSNPATVHLTPSPLGILRPPLLTKSSRSSKTSLTPVMTSKSRYR